MKTAAYLFTFFLLLSSGISAQNKNSKDLDALLKKQCVQVSGTSLMSKYEVSNKLYKLFLDDLKKSAPAKYEIAKADSSRWNEKPFNNPSLAKYYHSHPQYENFPVVNISHEAAVLFCEWLKMKYNSLTTLKVEEVRLPTAAEWDAAAKAGNPNAVYSWPGTTLFDDKGKPYGQFRGASEAMSVPGKLNESWEETAPVDTFKPNALGLYNMCGNVAEMLKEPKQTKGGAWNSSEEDLKINGPDTFAGSGPSPFIGFRYIVILEK